MVCATDEALRAKLSAHMGRREAMTIEFPEVGYEVTIRPATGAEYRAYLSEDKQPKSASRLSLVLSCLLFPDVTTFNGLIDELPGISSLCFQEIDDAAAPDGLDVFDLTPNSAGRLTRMNQDVVSKAMSEHRTAKGVTIARSPLGEVHFILRPPPRATYDDFEDATGMATVVPAADRGMFDCVIGMTADEIRALIETHPGLPILLYRDIREMACPTLADGARRKKARRVV